jgi:pyridoxal phosphate enzyme (YggS family)
MFPMTETMAARILRIKERISNAATSVGRDPMSVRLIAVSKTQPADRLREAMAAGVSVFGESKVQEAETKIDSIGLDMAEWHLIGHLQSNKARRAVRLFDMIHSVDSVDLAERLERICGEEGRGELPVLIQVDLAGEATKNGISPEQLPTLVEFLRECRYVKLRGLMTVPPYFEDLDMVRPYFSILRVLRDELVPDGELSMGMSHDFEAAIAEGATLVRIGTAIFGEREYV